MTHPVEEALGQPVFKGPSREPFTPSVLEQCGGYLEFAQAYAGAEFGDGAYRVHDALSGSNSMSLVEEYFFWRAGELFPFAFDWLGRQFALDSSKPLKGSFQVVLLEPGSGQILNTPEDFVGFHERELVEFGDEDLAVDFFRAWREQRSLLTGSPRELSWNECVGYKVPMFLGGLDELQNLEVVDVDVYWTLLGQLASSARGIESNTRITGVQHGD